jgi:quercetin dioxygenase-like cupin family protein
MRLILLFCFALGLQAQSANVATLLAKDIPEFAGKEVIMLTVAYPPGHASSAHRHNAHVFVYVLEGSVVMQVEGEEAKTLGPGETFYEKPSDIHTVSKNASATVPAKILVLMLKDKDAPVTRPAK